jgi:hypothetical protein
MEFNFNEQYTQNAGSFMNDPTFKIAPKASMECLYGSAYGRVSNSYYNPRELVDSFPQSTKAPTVLLPENAFDGKNSASIYSNISMRDHLDFDNRHSSEALINKFQFIANLPVHDLKALGTKKEFIHLAKEHKRIMGLGKKIWTREVADNFRIAMQAFSKTGAQTKTGQTKTGQTKNKTIQSATERGKKYTHVELLTKFYNEYNSKNIHKIHLLLKRYDGRELLLFSKLEKKYNVSNYFSKFVLKPKTKSVLKPKTGTEKFGGKRKR